MPSLSRQRLRRYKQRSFYASVPTTIYDANTGKPRTVVDIERAAPWCVGSNLDRYAYKAPEHGNSSSPAGEEAMMVIPTLPDKEAA
jgi:hypothetical protein